MPDTDDTLPPDQVSQLIDLALGATDGEPFTLGGREFKRAFLMIDAEQDLAGMLVNLIKRAPSLDLADVMLTSAREVQHAAALIIADYDHPGAEPDAVTGHRAEALRWLRTTRGVTTDALLQLVLAQIALNALGGLLGKLSTVLAPFAAIAVRRHPNMSPELAFLAGSGSAPETPSA